MLRLRVNVTETADKTLYRFDGIVVDAHNFVVQKDGEVVALTPRSFDVLLLLLRNNGHVVEKRQLFDEVWKETFVSDNALTKVVRELRHALADSAENPKYIETIPKRGYRFIGGLEETSFPAESQSEPVSTDSAAHRESSLSTGRMLIIAAIVFAAIAALWFAFDRRDNRTSPSTIAVLPFKPLDAESRDESLELGMAETLITRLSNLRDTVVRPIGSVRKFTDPLQDPVKAGEELQAEAVLDGSIQKAGDRIRVSVRLIDVRTGAALWSEQFDESFTDIFGVQDSIAQRIVSVLALKLSRREQEQLAKHMTDNPAAYELYLRGQFHWHRRGPDWINQSLNAYKLALEEDPNFALAHIGVADSYIMLSGHRRISMREAEANAAPSIMKALQIDGTLAQAHNALAELKYQYQYDWRGGEAEFRTAIELNPNVAWIRQAYGWFLMSDGRFDEANAEMERARQLDPSSLTLSAARGRFYYYSRQYDKALQHFQGLVAEEPNDISLHIALGAVYQQKGMHREAVEEFLKVQTLNGVNSEKSEEFRQAFNSGGREAFLRKFIASLDEAAAASFANAYVRLGDKEKAFFWFEKLFEAHDVSILQFKVEPAYDILRDDPRYAILLRKIGLEP